ncbi:hypothetical protein CL617_00765 [archaeon]|nr:hypothetical protein [archaeon]|tara:strand:- start:6959 stop:7207 length:249 start_codon:yes stop_codon:yes gene_type:complete
MVLIDTDFGVKLVFILGITNIIALFLVLLSCRCMGSVKIINYFWKYEWFKKFYSLHCYYWWLFVISVLLHAVFAFIVFGNPF